jgi:hypothetical protein
MNKAITFSLKALAVYATSILSSVIVLGAVGISPGPHPAEGLMSAGSAMLLVHALTVGIVLLVAAFATVRGVALALLIFIVLFGTQTAMMQIETLAFNHSVGMPLRDVIVLILSGAINAAAIAAVAALLFRGPSAGALASPPELGWRLAAASLAYVVCYYGAGFFLAWSSEAVREYYGQGEGIDQRFLLPFQVFRGLLWSLIALFLALRMKGPLLQRVAIMALLFPLLTAPQLLYPNTYMPLAVASAHLIEIAVSEAIWGAIAGLLLLPWRLKEPLAARSIQAGSAPV